MPNSRDSKFLPDNIKKPKSPAGTENRNDTEKISNNRLKGTLLKFDKNESVNTPPNTPPVRESPGK